MGKKDSAGLAIGLSIGTAVGIAIGIANDNIPLWLAMGLSLGLVFGISYDEQQKKRARIEQPRILDGVSYTILRRPHPIPGQRHHCWVGDNGAEIELTEQEASTLELD